MGRARGRGKGRGVRGGKRRQARDSDDASSSSSVLALDNDYAEPAKKRASGRTERAAGSYSEMVNSTTSYDRNVSSYLSSSYSSMPTLTSSNRSAPASAKSSIALSSKLMQNEGTYSLSSSAVSRSNTSDKSAFNNAYQKELKALGKEAENVIGSQWRDSELHLLIKWKNSDEAEMIPAKVARYKYPAAVIGFYEEKFVNEMRAGLQRPVATNGRKSYP